MATCYSEMPCQYTFEAKYNSAYRVLCRVNEHTLLLLTLDGKEWKAHIGDVKPCTMTD